MNVLGGMKKLWIVLVGGGEGWSLQNWTILVGHFYTFYGFLRSKYRIGVFFGIAKFQIFFDMPDIPDTFLG